MIVCCRTPGLKVIVALGGVLSPPMHCKRVNYSFYMTLRHLQPYGLQLLEALCNGENEPELNMYTGFHDQLGSSQLYSQISKGAVCVWPSEGNKGGRERWEKLLSWLESDDSLSLGEIHWACLERKVCTFRKVLTLSLKMLSSTIVKNLNSSYTREVHAALSWCLFVEHLIFNSVHTNLHIQNINSM